MSDESDIRAGQLWHYTDGVVESYDLVLSVEHNGSDERGNGIFTVVTYYVTRIDEDVEDGIDVCSMSMFRERAVGGKHTLIGDVE